MNTRNLALLSVLLVLVIGAGVALLGQDSRAGELRPGAPAAVDDPAVGAPPSTPDGDVEAATAAGAGFRRSDGVGAVEPTFREQEDTRGWTSGVIRGDIKLAVSALDKLGSMTIVVEEARRAFDSGPDKRPVRIVQKVERGNGTPTFEVRDVPFSEYPYIVMVHAPGLNGGRRTVVVDEQHALVDVVLSITPGAPFSILLRDQDQRPHIGVTVDMVPIEEPFGRTRHQGVTDNFGSVVFDDVLAGPYQLRATAEGQPFGEPERVVVMEGKQAFGRKIQGQGHVLTVARGVPLELMVHDGAGYGIPDATVTITKTDRVKLTEFECLTDGIGRASFPHLQPGTWQITVARDKFQRVDQQITLKADEPPPQRNIKLVRSRW